MENCLTDSPKAEHKTYGSPIPFLDISVTNQYMCALRTFMSLFPEVLFIMAQTGNYHSAQQWNRWINYWNVCTLIIYSNEKKQTAALCNSMNES